MLSIAEVMLSIEGRGRDAKANGGGPISPRDSKMWGFTVVGRTVSRSTPLLSGNKTIKSFDNPHYPRDAIALNFSSSLYLYID